MSSLLCLVVARLPYAVVELSGTLDLRTLTEAERTLRDCLAEMPSAVLLDCSAVSFPDSEVLSRLNALGDSASAWPGARLCLCGLPAGVVAESLSLGLFPTVESARASLEEQMSDELRRQVTLPPVPESCGEARDFVADACADWGLRRPSNLAQLLISELVANGVMHARTPLGVTVRKVGEGVEISVRDSDPTLVSYTPVDDPRGFGLQLVATMSDSWGCAPTSEGKVVWSRVGGVR